MSPEEIQSTLDAAWALEKKWEEIIDTQDQVLMPLMRYAIDKMTDDELVDLVARMPGGFHRCELRTLMRERGITK